MIARVDSWRVVADFVPKQGSNRASATPASLPRATWVGICHEGEPGGCLARITEEGTEVSAVEFEPAAQEGRVLGGVTPIRPGVGDDQPDAHRRRTPASLGRDCAGQANLAVKGAERLVEVHEFGLEFHNHEMSRGLVPRQLVDDSALTVDRE